MASALLRLLALALCVAFTHALQVGSVGSVSSRTAAFSARLPAVVAAVVEEEEEGFTFGDAGEIGGETVAAMVVEEEELTEKQKEIARLRAAEKFMKKDTGDAICNVCNYKWNMMDGDGRIPRNTPFQMLPDNYVCPNCNAPKEFFDPVQIEIAGFADNQNYGFGNSMTEEGKSTLIFGGLGAFFLLLMGGYALN